MLRCAPPSPNTHQLTATPPEIAAPPTAPRNDRIIGTIGCAMRTDLPSSRRPGGHSTPYAHPIAPLCTSRTTGTIR